MLFLDEGECIVSQTLRPKHITNQIILLYDICDFLPHFLAFYIFVAKLREQFTLAKCRKILNQTKHLNSLW